MSTDWYREGFWKGTTKFWNIPSCDYEVINLGSNSGKYAFCYDGLPVKGMNWAIGPQSLVHDFNILKNSVSTLFTALCISSFVTVKLDKVTLSNF